LRPILAAGGTIIAARRRLTWPGAAAVVVSVVHVLKGAALESPLLDGKPQQRISAFLVDGEQDATPPLLRANAGIAFQGSILLGMGFTFDDETNEPAANRLSEMQRLIAKDQRNAERIKPYIGGEEVNDSPTHVHHRYAIDFEDFPLQREDLGFAWLDADDHQRAVCLRDGIVPLDYPEPVATDWPALLAIVEARVKPARLAQNREVRARYWWRHGERAPALYDAIRGQARVLAINCGACPHMALAFLPNQAIFANTLDIIARDTFGWFALLQSRVHEVWVRFFSSTMKDDIRYTPSDCFETFPLPGDETILATLESIGCQYYEARTALMRSTNRGLTEIYNFFNNPEEHDQFIEHLRELHSAMDREVLDAYGWIDLNPFASHEREWEAQEGENPAPWRLRWPEADRGVVLARLLELNRRRNEEESHEISPALPTRRRRRRVAPAELMTLLN
jgi:hypothetical protein